MRQQFTQHEPMQAVPDIGVPYEPGTKFIDLRDRAMAACNTAKDLANFGLDLTTTEEDNEIAAILAEAYAIDSDGVSKEITHNKFSDVRPASLVLVGSILDEFGQLVVQNSVHLRNMVTNKLVLESENPDARIRIRALELLGKISDVGLFTEKKEVTVHHTSTEDLRAKLKNKLSRLVSPEEEVNPTYAAYEVIED